MSLIESAGELDFGEMSDEELQEAFAAGLLKPGLNVRLEQKPLKNNVAALKQQYADLKSKLNWIERLDLEVKPAPIAPELQFEVNEKEKENIVNLKSKWRLPIKQKDKVDLDDFKREILFHRQAQSAVLEGITRLKALGVPTQRPDDYFAEMMKSDDHMHKVRQSLAARQAGAMMSEKVRQLRRLKKMGKQIQIENKLKQQSEKKKMLEEVKKFRKGKRKDLDFLETKKLSKKVKITKKQQMKNEKYGFGGKKRGSKRNTKESSAWFGSSGRKGKGKTKEKDRKKRLGKSRRIKLKSRK